MQCAIARKGRSIMTREAKVLRMVANGRMMTNNSYVILSNPINIDRNYKAYRFEGRKTATCNIIGCNNVCTCDNGSIKVITPFAPLGLTLCRYHANNVSSYSSENTVFAGIPTHDGITMSCELETSDNTPISRASFGQTKYGMLCMPTSDGSLNGHEPIEWKTRVYHSLQGATKLFGCFEAMLTENHISMDNKCGSHLHTGLSDNSMDFRRLFPDIATYFEAFGGVYEYLDKMPNAKMKEYFGRGFVGYARTLRKTANGYEMPKHDGNGKNMHDTRHFNGHENLYGTESYNCDQHLLAFNLQHSYSIEFRLARFTNATMYRKIAVVMHNVVIFLRDYHNGDISISTLNKALTALFKENYPY